MKKYITYFLVVIGLMIFSMFNVYANNDDLGIKKIDGIPYFSQEEYNKAKVKIDILWSETCPVCKIIEEDLPTKIYSKFTSEQVAIRFWDVKNINARNYFKELLDRNNIPKEAENIVPTIFINNKYGFAGYNSEISAQILEDVVALTNDQIAPYTGDLQLIANSIRKQNNNPSLGTSLFNQSLFKEGLRKKVLDSVKLNRYGSVSYLINGIVDSFYSVNILLFFIAYLLLTKDLLFRNLRALIFLLGISLFAIVSFFGILQISYKLSLVVNIVISLSSIVIYYLNVYNDGDSEILGFDRIVLFITLIIGFIAAIPNNGLYATYIAYAGLNILSVVLYIIGYLLLFFVTYLFEYKIIDFVRENNNKISISYLFTFFAFLSLFFAVYYFI